MAKKLQPGSMISLDIDLDKFFEKKEKFDDYSSYLSSFKSQIHPPGTEQLVNKMVEIFNKGIEVEKSELFGTNSLVPVELEDTLKKIKKQCSEYLAAAKKVDRIFYRGVKSYTSAFVGMPHNNRYPKDSSRNLDALYNKWLASKGFEARRDNSIFVTASRDHATGYGHKCYMIFPINGFKFSWIKNKSDLILKGKYYEELLNRDHALELYDAIFNDEVYKQLVIDNLLNFDKSREYVGKNTGGFFSSNGGFLYYGNFETQVLGIHSMIKNGYLPKDPFEKLSSFEYLLDINKFGKIFDVRNTDLDKALDNYGEVNINGKYFAIDSRLRSEVRQYFGLSPEEPYGYFKGEEKD